MRIILSLLSIIFLAVLAVPASAQETEAGESILILDASGSMWGQIEGEAKITIAKRVLGDLLADLPTERRLGLMVYGHRREGDCSDIEELAAVGADRETIAAAVQGLSPKGKTPMADSIKLAAEKLRYTEKKATVILVSDGIETCAPDPCGVAAALEQSGVDFTVHVIGFNVAEENDAAQLRCIAENTGGTYNSATDAGELSEALEETVAAAPEVVTVTKVRLRATELEGGLVIEEGLNWSIKDRDGNEVYASEGEGVVDVDIDPGAYDIAVMRPSDGLNGELKAVKIQENTWKTITIALTFPVEATVRVEPESEGMAGTRIKVFWTGPDREGDYVTISEKGSDRSRYRSYRYTSQGSPSELRLPVDPGEYEIRYMLGRPIRILASKDFIVTPASATLMAKDEAIAGEEVEVDFTGPPAASGDYITITKPDAAERAYMDYHYTRQGSPATIRMPLEPGGYELRFVQNSQKVLARRPIKVAAAEATISGPETAIAGEEVEVEFTGPKPGSGDWITVTKPDAKPSHYNDYAYTRQGSPATIRMPLEAGEYELRFVQGNKKVIARQKIIVTEATATLSAKDNAIAGETVTVEYTGPKAASSDWITVTAPDAPPGTYGDYEYTKQGSPAEIRMPLDAGAYEIRFVQGGKKILARHPITVSPASATLDGPSIAKASELIEVGFTGPPAGGGDYIAVAKPDAGVRGYESYGYVAQGSPAKVRMPREHGQYELRYIHGNEKILARAPITVTPKD